MLAVELDAGRPYHIATLFDLRYEFIGEIAIDLHDGEGEAARILSAQRKIRDIHLDIPEEFADSPYYAGSIVILEYQQLPVWNKVDPVVVHPDDMLPSLFRDRSDNLYRRILRFDLDFDHILVCTGFSGAFLYRDPAFLCEHGRDHIIYVGTVCHLEHPLDRCDRVRTQLVARSILIAKDIPPQCDRALPDGPTSLFAQPCGQDPYLSRKAKKVFLLLVEML